MPGGQGDRVFGAEDPLKDGQQLGEPVAGPGRIPGRPVKGATWERLPKVSRCSGPKDRSRASSTRCCRSNAAA